MWKSPIGPFFRYLGPCLAALTLSCLNTSADLGRVAGQRVLQHVEKIVEFGPHPPGSRAQKGVGRYLIDQLRSYGLQVQTHSFEPVTPMGRLAMRNIWGVRPGTEDSILILASHYDSKYFAEFPFVGANDGGSSSGLLLELARILAEENPISHTLWFVFFDGEEALARWSNLDSLYGSREFVEMLKRRGELHRVAGLLLLDLVGGKDLMLLRDSNSDPELNDIIWKQARQMGHGDVFRRGGNTAAVDDHLPFAREGIRVVDLIDLSYAHWHSPEDTPDKLSPENLALVGEVVLASLPRISQKLKQP